MKKLIRWILFIIAILYWINSSLSISIIDSLWTDKQIDWDEYVECVSSDNPARNTLNLENFNKKYNNVIISAIVKSYGSFEDCVHVTIDTKYSDLNVYVWLDLEDIAKLDIGDKITVNGKFKAYDNSISIGRSSNHAKLLKIN